MARNPALTVVYDGECNLCTTSVAALKRMDWLRRLAYLDATDEGRVAEAFPELPKGNLLAEIHVVADDGRYWTGYYGLRRLAWLLPPLWLLAPLMLVPGVSWLGTRVYAFVAARRARNLCDGETCRVNHGVA